MLDKYLSIAKEAAIEAGKMLSKRQSVHVDANLKRDIKLSADKESENIIIECLNTTKLPILSEESGLSESNENGYYWIVDPLDGTVNYYKGIDELCCVSIALFEGKTPVLGVVNRYAMNELYSGIVGQSANVNGIHVKPSVVTSLEEAVFSTGFPKSMDFSDDALRRFINNVQRVKKVRMLGSAALMASFVATGNVDLYFEDGIFLWDVAGAAAIVEAAGGVTCLQMSDSNYRCSFGAFSTVSIMEEFYGT